ncbi:PREDICTED: 40S ribosomal protein S11-like [Gekko japonicus]|uniref:Small ribosomal subunit protein uS17 n=1 Tax=Gekko japonicus TaxID=146911 RepID=A0ABM1KFQ6_GEKJA|nr:PREDICTED: 40S ribosomal protein S11-like [Gekko japonicus]
MRRLVRAGIFKCSFCIGNSAPAYDLGALLITFSLLFFLQAIEGTYIDKKCPFTGNVSIRGRILSGVVTKMKMQRTIVIRRDYLHYIRKYNRFEKRHKNMSVHLSPCFRDVQIGDIVTVGECRPLSKTVRFNVLKVTKAAGTKKQFQKF